MATRRVMSAARFESKAAARQHAWDMLADQGLARFPFPPHGRIPNFKDARAAAERLFREAPWVDACAIKVNPDSPQKWVRQRALELGIRVYVPTPKLAGGFHLLDPELIPPQCYGDAATLKSMTQFSIDVTLSEMPQLDAIVSGCAAVTRTGKRCGKGAGYSDIEYALLLELGHEPVPVATTVHDMQVVDDFPVMSNDLPLALIATPTQTIRVARALTAPSGIDWSVIDAKTVDAMPPLRELLDDRG